jgi:hypothetical protein
MELIPNCLLTRFPIVFTGGPWQQGPEFLREHGYDVVVLHEAYLPDLERKVHLLVGGKTEVPGGWLERNQDWIVSSAFVNASELERPDLDKALLSHAISLAENDLKCSH